MIHLIQKRRLMEESAMLPDNGSSSCDDLPIPSAKELFQGTQRKGNIIMVCVATVVVMLTCLIFVDIVVFINKHFKLRERQKRTIWVVSIFPIFSVCSFIGAFVPRASTIVDLVMNVFLSSCLYQFLLLLEDYIGEKHIAWEMIKDKMIRTNAPPVLCCFVCLPKVPVTKNFLLTVRLMVVQVTFARPLLSLIAAVMWAEGVYVPGFISGTSPYLYITILNLISSVTAVTGLFLVRSCFDAILKQYQPAGKFMAIQFVLLLTIIPSLVINLLVGQGLIPCYDYLPSKSRGDRILHGFVLCLMLPLILMGRFFYRRQWEGLPNYCAATKEKQPGDLPYTVTCKEKSFDTSTDKNAFSNGLIISYL